MKKKVIKAKTRRKGKTKVSHHFITILAIVSILGFLGIASKTILNRDITAYIESLWMLIIGIGLIVEAKIKSLKSISKKLTSNNLTHLITIIIGAIAILAALLGLPLLRIQIQSPAFAAIKGIISIIAIIIIIIQTWVID